MLSFVSDWVLYALTFVPAKTTVVALNLAALRIHCLGLHLGTFLSQFAIPAINTVSAASSV